MTDHLGSIISMADNGDLCYDVHYDVWGNREVGLPFYYSIERGFTGHEHIDGIGLIDMRGRMYDPVLGRFLSPDAFVQAPTNPQNFNRYSYCLNNPLKYSDPSGNFFLETFVIGIKDFFVTAFFKGGLDLSSPGAMRDAWKDFDPTASWSKTNKSWKMSVGFYKTDSSKSFWGRAWEIASRFTWQAPQSFLGNTVNQIHNAFGGVKSVSFYGGATVVESYAKEWGAFTLGSFINGNRGIKADPRNSLFQHEYGHYLQSQDWGPLYLSKCAVPSLIDCSMDYFNHNYHPVEQDANIRAFKYFTKNEPGFVKIKEDGSVDTLWDFDFNPILNYPSDNMTLNNVYLDKALSKKLSLKSYDIFDIFALGSINTVYDTYQQIIRRIVYGQ
ncbi:MAG: RHS repeat-associated core domain-containing protein, partial [Bacteroidaceae bacterium]|nr:RHS repeat-associated core domain-containing protein [Bacteroidaceae bacterium]